MLSTAAAMAVLGGCQLAPPHVQPALPTAQTYPEAYTGDATQGEPARALSWRDFIADPRLKSLIATALQRNRDLAVAVAQIEEARSLYRVQRSQRLPTVDAGAAATRSRISTTSTGGTTIPVVPGVSDAVTYDRYSVEVGIPAFELDFWGRVRNLSEAARAEYLATVDAARAFQLSLIREVAAAYLNTLEAAERIALAEATVDSREQGLRIARRRLDAGVISALEYRQSETLLTEAQSALAGLRLTRAQSENLLAVLIGGPVDSPLANALPLSQQTPSQALAAGLPSELLAARPDVLAAEERLRAARANIGAARAAYFPSITLTGSFGYASTELDDLIGDANQTWSFGPSISLPIFDFGRRRGNLDAARARADIAIANYESTIQRAFQEVADALAGRRYLAEQVAAQQRGVVAQRDLVQLAGTRYREGVVSYLEVLDAERTLFSAEQALLQTQRAEAANLVSLFVALGGGSE